MKPESGNESVLTSGIFSVNREVNVSISHAFYSRPAKHVTSSSFIQWKITRSIAVKIYKTILLQSVPKLNQIFILLMLQLILYMTFYL